MRHSSLYAVLTFALAAQAQQPIPPYVQANPPATLPPGGLPPPKPLPGRNPTAQPPAAQPKPAQPQATPATPAPATPTPAAAAPAPAPQTPAAPAPQTQPAQAPPANVSVPGALNLTGASLLEVIDLLARDLHINYILDSRVKGGSVTINTYGEIKAMDLRPLLETILRMNGYQMVEVGNMYRIVPVAEASRLPVPPQANATNLPDDERIILNLVFLKFVTSGEIAKLLDPFKGDGAL